MAVSARPHRHDTATWAAAVIMLLCAVVAGVTVAIRPLPSPVSQAQPTPAETSQAAERPAPRPANARVTAFQARLAAFAPLEAKVWRAFFPPAPSPPRQIARSGRRVAQGATAQTCLAQAVYYEARGEPAEGQAAVAQVVLNRTRATGRPSSVCGVVFQGASHAGCQFSFACDGRLGGRRVNAAAWARAQTVASDALAGHEAPELRTAVNYHADYVRPGWAARLQRTAEIGRHIFYAAAAPASRAWAAWTAPGATPTPPATTD